MIYHPYRKDVIQTEEPHIYFSTDTLPIVSFEYINRIEYRKLATDFTSRFIMKAKKTDMTYENSDHILISYPAGIPEHPDWFIYEYESHRKVLVQVDSGTGKVQFLKEL